MKKKVLWLTTCIIGISLVTTVWISPPFSLIALLDIMFALSLLLTLIGASMYILQSGFFHPFIQNFRYFVRKINRSGQIADQLEQKDHDISMPRIQLPLTLPFMIAGIILTIISSLFSIIL